MVAEGQLHVGPYDKYNLVEAGLGRIVDGVVHDNLPMGAHAFELL